MPPSASKAPATPAAKSGRTNTQQESVKKFGAAVAARFTIVPALLFEKQRELKISPVEFAVLLQLMSYWWKANDLPWPSKRDLGARLDMDESNVRRHITSLCEKNIIERFGRTDKATRRQTSNKYSFKPLVQKLKKLAEQAHKKSQKEIPHADRSP